MLITLLFACEVEPVDETTWSGYAYERNASGDMVVIESEEASLELLNLNGEVLVAGEQPYDSPYWTFTLDNAWLDQEIAIRIDAPEIDPMLWRGKAPVNDAIWLNQSIFGHSIGYNANYFAQMSEFAEIDTLSDSIHCHLWGQPLTPEHWANADFELTDGDGNAVNVFAWSVDDQGILSDDISEKVDLFMAFNILPGTVVLKITTPDGRYAETLYPAKAGDLLSAFYYVFPNSND